MEFNSGFKGLNLKAVQQNASVWSFSRITAFDRRCTRGIYKKKNKTFFIVFNVSSFLAAEYPSLQLNSLPFPRTCNFALFLLYVTTEIMKVCRLGFYLLFVQFYVRNKLFISLQFTVEAT